MSVDKDITENSSEALTVVEDNLIVNISDSTDAIQRLTNWTAWYDNEEFSDIDTRNADLIKHETSFLYWLQMFGIFMGSLVALAIITLITCRRPHKTVQIIEEPVAPDPVYIIEEPPNYEDIMELEMEDLPSYTDVVKAEIHYFENINV